MEAQQQQEISFAVYCEGVAIYERNLIIPYGGHFYDLISVPEGALLTASTTLKRLNYIIPSLSEEAGILRVSKRPWDLVKAEDWNE